MINFLVCGDCKNTLELAIELKKRFRGKVLPNNIFIHSSGREHKTSLRVRKIINNKIVDQPRWLKRKAIKLLVEKKERKKGHIFVTNSAGIDRILNSLKDEYRVFKGCRNPKKGTILLVQNGRKNIVQKVFSI